MLNSSLIDILKTFTKDEFKKLELLVRSPYYNKNSNVVALYNFLKKYFPEFDDKKLKREIAWKELYPDKPFNYGVMKNLIHGLQKLAEKLMELQIYENNIFQQKKNLSDALMDRTLNDLYEKNLKSAKKEIQKSDVFPDYYHYKYIFEAQEQNYFYHNRKAKEPGFCKPFAMNESLSSSFFTNFFSENYNSLLESKFYNKSYDTGFIRAVFDFFHNSLSKNDEYVQLFYYSLKILIDNDDDKSFNLLKEILKKNINILNERLSFNLAMSLVNYCNFQLMKGKLSFIDDQFEICKLLVEHNMLKSESTKYIDSSLFVKITSSACASKEFDWAEKFIDKHKNSLHPDDRDRALMQALITLSIKRKNFDAALDYLSKADVKELIQRINIKRYQVMIYYELGYINELYSFIDTSKHFISNDNKSSEAVKKTFYNFISIVLKLLSLKSNPSKNLKGSYELENLKKEIEGTESPNKLWMMEKIAELATRAH